MKIHSIFIAGFLGLSSFSVLAADVPVPVATDSRIKTFVYSENDVFNIVAHYGYQSNIEFPSGEQVETISMGNRMGWQIVTAGRRLFIRPTLANARTNMTVVTSKHAYQFDLTAVPAVYSPNEELAYVIRFYYPDEKRDRLPQAPYYDDVASSSPVSSADVRGGNYNYSYSGDAAAAPVKVYDDGSVTYFKFPADAEPTSISVLDAGRKEVPVSMRRQGDLWVVDTVASQFVLHRGELTACVFNEKYTHK